MYAAADLIDAKGQNIGCTNDTTSGGGPGKMAVLLLGTYDYVTDVMRISKISCYRGLHPNLHNLCAIEYLEPGILEDFPIVEWFDPLDRLSA